MATVTIPRYDINGIETHSEDIDDSIEDDIDLARELDDDDPIDNPSPQRSTHMQISLQPTDTAARTASAKTWLQRILAQPSLGGIEFPRELKGYIYVDNVAHQLTRGTWTISDQCVYLAGTSTNVDPLTRLGVLTTVANMYDAITDPAIVELITTRLCSAISESVRSVYHGFVRGTQAPSRLAVDQANARVAAEMNGSWFLTSGAPVTVDNTWIIMDF